MSVFFTILLGLLGLSIVIFFHELGHFFMAKLVGIPVLEFSIGKIGRASCRERV